MRQSFKKPSKSALHQRVTDSRGGGLRYLARMCKNFDALAGLSGLSRETTFTWHGS